MIISIMNTIIIFELVFDSYNYTRGAGSNLLAMGATVGQATVARILKCIIMPLAPAIYL